MDLTARVIGLMLLVRALALAQISEGPELDAAKSLVVMIEGNLGENSTRGGGIVFAVDGGRVYIATAYHVVRPGEKRATELKVRFRQRPNDSYTGEHHEDASFEHDLAILKVRALGLQFQLDVLADSASFRESVKVFAIGYPRGSRWGVNQTPGMITEVRSQKLFVESPYITVGHSGGALVDDRMRLTGMVLDTDGAIASALRIDRLVAILREDVKLPVQLRASSRVSSSLQSKTESPSPGGDSSLAPSPRAKYGGSCRGGKGCNCSA